MAFVFALSGVFAQQNASSIREQAERLATANGLSPDDMKGLNHQRSVPNRKSGHTYHYLQQTLNGIAIEGALMTAVEAPEGGILHINHTFVRGIQRYTAAAAPGLKAEAALGRALSALGIQGNVPAMIEPSSGTEQAGRFDKGDVSLAEIPFKLTYVPAGNRLVLCWELVIQTTDTRHWWQAFVDAETGALIKRNDWIVECNWDAPHGHSLACAPTIAGRNPLLTPEAAAAPPMPVNDGSSYRVYPEPLRSPYDGPRALINQPWAGTPLASPFGWHDTNGAPGAEYTITRGNNVYATEDRNADNLPGFAPDGGAGLDFDFALDLSQSPINYQEAAITNLFYWNNLCHDVFYYYGFDEASGNFQENNYGNGSQGNDQVFADAQDGSGTNNANFGTPPDGENPRMQMFEWTITEVSFVNANGTAYAAVPATFGPQSASVSAQLVLYLDNAGGPSLACAAPFNAAALNGRIALIDRGSCNFTAKVQNAENAGAVAVIVVQNVADAPFAMGGTDPGLTIPSVMVSLADGNALKAALQQGVVNATINLASGVNRDSDLDNEVIAHEYGHGISTRLTAGADNVGCLFNQEQMGEGWSDYFGLILTMEPGDGPFDARGIGNYSFGDGPNGGGIRPFPYSFDLAVNPVTYNDISGLSIPHGVGSVWCSMLWDMTWLLVGEYGFDPDVYNGNGGNNIALQLVMEGLKLQPCSPGFVDGRDAILLADQLLYGGANQCLIWEAFARRGLGANADQGSSSSVTDGTESYEFGASCSVSIEKSAATTMQAGSSSVVTLTITNSSGLTATNVTVTDVIPTEVTYVPGSASCTVTQAGSTLTFNLGTMADGDVVVCTYSVAAPAGNFTVATLNDDLESGAAGYTTQTDVGPESWSLSNLRFSSPTTSWFAPDLNQDSDMSLILPNLTGITATTFLSIRHLYNTEATWDGGVIEYSTDGGANWNDLGPLITLNGYNGSINTNSGTGIAGRQAYTGGSGGFIETTADLSSLAGQTVSFRFRMVADFIIGAEGWYIDDIFIGEQKVEFENTACVSSDQTALLCSTARTLVVEPTPCLGDFNNDGLVNAPDLLIMLAEFGCSGTCFTDLSTNGFVGTEDIIFFLTLYNTICD